LIKYIDAEIYFKLNTDPYNISLTPMLDFRIKFSDETTHKIHAKFTDGYCDINQEDEARYDPQLIREMYCKLNTQANIDRILGVIKTMAAKVEETYKYTCIGLDCNEE